MLKIRVLGQFEVRYDGRSLELPSRPAQSLLSYLALNAGISHRREKLAGMLWPDSTETNARGYLRHALWRVRRALDVAPFSWRDYLDADDIAICFLQDADYWLDASQLLSRPDEGWTLDTLAETVSLYQGELLPGFYDEWTVLERERLRAAFDQKMRLLLDRQVEGWQWDAVLEWGERWIALGLVPDAAYRALMLAQTGIGDRAGVDAVYRRYADALERELGLEPAEEMQTFYEGLATGETPVTAQPPAAVDAWEVPAGPPAPGAPPFKGLQYFDVGDADLYFGRGPVVERLVGHLAEGHPLAIVVGGSGSGKSSLVRAGLVPAMQKGSPLPGGTNPPEGSSGWLVRIVRPTGHPLRALAQCLADGEAGAADLAEAMARDREGLGRAGARLLEERQAPALLLIVDQLEELFSQCRQESDRQAFVDNLLTAAVPGGPIRTVLALRSDFYAHCAAYAGLRESLERDQFYLGPMSARELRQAIEGPAKQGDWAFQPGLVDLLLRDVRGEPGALPLLSHALLETWKRRSGRTLTLQGYAASGGVRGAVARTAETVYNQRLDARQQSIARNLFLRLTEVGEERQDTRRRAALAELIPGPEQAQAVEEVLEILAEARLVTLTRDPALPRPGAAGGTAEVAHEALIREWPTLRAWIEEDREGLRIHRHLTEAARDWEELNRDPGELYRGGRLTQTQEWAAAHYDRLNELERAFLGASAALEAEEEAEREAQRQRELDAARKLAEAEGQRAEEQARSSRRLRWFSAGLALLLIVALAAGALAVLQRGRAESEAHLSKSRELAAAALSNLEMDSELSALLALAAVEEAEANRLPVPREAVEAVHQAVPGLRVHAVLRGHDGAVTSAQFSPDGSRVATAGADGTARLWDAASGEQILVLATEAEPLASVAFAPDGDLVATGSTGGCAKVWDATTGAEVVAFCDHREGVSDVAFSPDGAALFTSSLDGRVRQWAMATAGTLPVDFAHGVPILRIDLSPDGSRLASSSAAGTARVWDTTSSEVLLDIQSLLTEWMNEIAFGPGGRLLAATESTQVSIWDVEAGEERRSFFAHAHDTRAVAFSPDGTLLATGGADRRARIWDAGTGRLLLTLAGHAGDVESVAVSPDGQRLITASADGTARIWDLSPGREWLTLPLPGMVGRIAFHPDGSILAAGAGWDGDLGIWDTTGGQMAFAPESGHQGPVFCAAYSPDGRLLATGGPDTTARVRDAATGELRYTIPDHRGIVFDLAFSPDGTLLASAGMDERVLLWDAATGDAVKELPHPRSAPRALAFRPDGTHLAAASLAGYTTLFDVEAGTAIGTLSGHSDTVEDVAYSPDGEWLVTCGGDETIILWDAESQAEVRRLTGNIGMVMGCDFSPDGRYVASAGLDGLARLWDVETGEELLALSGGTGEGLWTIAFSPDGKLLAAGDDYAIRLYLLELEELVALARGRLSRALTAEECQRYLRSEECGGLDGLATE